MNSPTAAEAAAYFAAKLAFETDPSDAWEALRSGVPGFVLIDSRSAAAWAQGHIAHAIGGFEYWSREGLPVEQAGGVAAEPADPLTAACGC